MVFAVAALACAIAAVVFTWQRLFVGMDLQDESFYILVPWRWALGDAPFVHEQNLAQISGLLEYPFIKLFGIVRAYDVTGLVLYARHLYLLLMVGVAAAALLVVRRLVRWELALPDAAVYVTYIFWETPQLSYNTMGAAFLTLGAILGLWVVLTGRSRLWAFASGVAYGLAIVAYPTLLFIMPFYAVFLAFALGRRAVSMVADLALVHPPNPEGPPTGRPAWRVLSVWVLGGVASLVPVGLVILSFGIKNLERCWAFTMEAAKGLGQLGGAAKAYQVAQGFWRFYWSLPYLIVAALLFLLVYRRWPTLGRVLLVAVPWALWMAGQRLELGGAGFVLVYAALAPYLFLFVPRSRRGAAAKLLLWVWAPAMIAGAMTAFTSAAGYQNAPVGLTPALLASGVFLAWALEAVASPVAASAVSPRRLPWLALVVLVAVVGVTVSFQFRYQQRDMSYAKLTSRFDAGPWYGIKVAPERRLLLDSYARDLAAQSRPDDALLVFYQSCGYYLYWDGAIAANSYWLSNSDPMAVLPQSTFSYYRRHRIVPSLVVHLIRTEGMTEAELQSAGGGLGYPTTLVRARYVFQRQPADETTAQVLARLPRK